MIDPSFITENKAQGHSQGQGAAGPQGGSGGLGGLGRAPAAHTLGVSLPRGTPWGQERTGATSSRPGQPPGSQSDPIPGRQTPGPGPGEARRHRTLSDPSAGAAAPAPSGTARGHRGSANRPTAPRAQEGAGGAPRCPLRRQRASSTPSLGGLASWGGAPPLGKFSPASAELGTRQPRPEGAGPGLTEAPGRDGTASGLSQGEAPRFPVFPACFLPFLPARC